MSMQYYKCVLDLFSSKFYLYLNLKAHSFEREQELGRMAEILDDRLQIKIWTINEKHEARD